MIREGSRSWRVRLALICGLAQRRGVNSVRMCADLRGAHVCGVSGSKGGAHCIRRDLAWPRDKQREPHLSSGGADRFGSNLAQGMRDVEAPAIERDRFEHDFARRPVEEWLRDHEYRQARGVIGALDERQPGNDLRGLRRRELRPPGTGARTPVHGEHAEIADRIANRADDLASPKMWRARSCEPEMKARRVSHRGVAARYVDMDAVGRLDIGEG